MGRKNTKKRLEIGQLYQWCPKTPFRLHSACYTIYMGEVFLECMFKEELAEYFTDEELAMPINMIRLPGSRDTQYRVILTGGRIGWISIDDSFVDDWKKAT
jgi:hypothetical protein